jgi:AcrR family transcriptional regulator
MTQQVDTEADLWADIPQDTAQRLLLLAALRLFASRGYHATSTRQIASTAGLSPAAMYVYFRSKADLLFEISRVGHESALRGIEAVVLPFQAPCDRMRALVQEFTSWHARHNTLARVAQYELQHLESRHYDEIAALRRSIAAVLRRELVYGIESGDFDITDIGKTTTAVLSLQIDVARWYSSSGPWSPDELGRAYGDLVLRMLSPASVNPASVIPASENRVPAVHDDRVAGVK